MTTHCTHPEKIRYESEAQAAAYAKAFAIGAKNRPHADRPYWCPGGHWHLTSKSKRGKNRVSSAKRQKRQRLLAEGVWESEGGALR